VRSELSVQVSLELGSFTACSTESEDHLPETALGSSSSFLQVSNLSLSCIDVLLEHFLDFQKDLVEFIGGSGAIFLELFENFDDSITFLE
jgi:hypothetical protein